MNTKEAADIIDAIASAIRSQPNQFSYEVTVIGQSVHTSGPGTGLSIQVQGGFGGTTIGQVVGVNTNAAVRIANKAVDGAVTTWATSTVEALESLSTALKEKSPDKTKVQDLVGKVGAVIGVPALQAAINAAVTVALS
jgi:hypothetical protein